MALAITEVLQRHGHIDQDQLAAAFVRRYERQPWRGYGGMARAILKAVGAGCSWREVSPSAFDGMGSMGNGGAMRVAPVGAYFADDLDRVVWEAKASAEITHAHPEGQAGAIAIAVAAAWAATPREFSRSSIEELFDTVLELTPEGQTRSGIEQACELSAELPVAAAANLLGNGSRVISQDTVPFCIWCIARHLDDYEEAMWETVSGLGDRDTTCAIVGGVVALACGREGIPEDWLAAREPLDAAPLPDEPVA
jgi:ADP-ribosylglycohydrolase